MPAGHPIAVPGEEDQLVYSRNDESTRAESPFAQPAPGPEVSVQEPPLESVPVVRASPVARLLADERGIDLSQVEGTGPGGRITRDDVLGFTPQVTEVESPSVEEEHQGNGQGNGSAIPLPSNMEDPTLQVVAQPEPPVEVEEAPAPDFVSYVDEPPVEVEEAPAPEPVSYVDEPPVEMEEAPAPDFVSYVDEPPVEVEEAPAPEPVSYVEQPPVEVEEAPAPEPVSYVDEPPIEVEEAPAPGFVSYVDEPPVEVEEAPAPDFVSYVDEPPVEVEEAPMPEPVSYVDEPPAEAVEESEPEPWVSEPESSVEDEPLDELEEEETDTEAWIEEVVAEAEAEEETVAEVDEEPAPEPVSYVEEPPIEVEGEPLDELEEEEADTETLIEEIIAEAEEEETAAEAQEEEVVAEVEAEEPIVEVEQRLSFHVSVDVDMGQALELRRQINEQLAGEDIHVTVDDLVVKACAQALVSFPSFKARCAGNGVSMNGHVNVGVDVSTDQGLTETVLLDCGGRSLRELSVASKELSDSAEAGVLPSEEHAGGGFSVSSMGAFDVSGFTAALEPHQGAVLAMGSVTKRPVVRNDEVTVGQVLTATLSVDHHVAEEADGARFIEEIKRLLENPLRLVV